MTRLLFQLIYLLACLLAAACSNPARAADAPRPNFLFCISDDQSWEHTGAAGDPVVQTPHFDSIARSGIFFSNSYCSTPSCTPSRASILTGQAFSRLEEGANLLSALPAKFVTYPDLLEQAGYAVGFTSKGWAPGDWRAAGRERNPCGPLFESFEAFLATVKPGQPFAFWLGSSDPHRPYAPGSGAAAGLDPAAVRVPPMLPDTPEMRADIADYLLEIQKFDDQVGAALSLLDSGGHRAKTVVVITSDNGMPYPRAKCNLYDYGTRMPLAIAWPGHVAPGRIADDFVSHTDFAPTFLELAGLPVPAEMTGRSLAPILASSASGAVDPSRDAAFFGRERHDTFRRSGPDSIPVGYPMRALRTGRFLYIRNYHPERVPSGDDPTVNQDNDRGPAKSVVVAGKDDPASAQLYRLAYGLRAAEELYDLEKDPGQLVNVASDPDYAGGLREMSARLDRTLTDLGDPRRPGSPNPDVLEQFPPRQTMRDQPRPAAPDSPRRGR